MLKSYNFLPSRRHYEHVHDFFAVLTSYKYKWTFDRIFAKNMYIYIY